ncbi:hypothetical protein ACFL5V_13155 [Fibrobacterota bacterium]
MELPDRPGLSLQEGEVESVKYLHWREMKAFIAEGGEGFVPHEREYEKLFEVLASLSKRPGTLE